MQMKCVSTILQGDSHFETYELPGANLKYFFLCVHFFCVWWGGGGLFI